MVLDHPLPIESIWTLVTKETVHCSSFIDRFNFFAPDCKVHPKKVQVSIATKIKPFSVAANEKKVQLSILREKLKLRFIKSFCFIARSLLILVHLFDQHQLQRENLSINRLFRSILIANRSFCPQKFSEKLCTPIKVIITDVVWLSIEKFAKKLASSFSLSLWIGPTLLVQRSHWVILSALIAPSQKLIWLDQKSLP